MQSPSAATFFIAATDYVIDHVSARLEHQHQLVLAFSELTRGVSYEIRDMAGCEAMRRPPVVPV